MNTIRNIPAYTFYDLQKLVQRLTQLEKENLSLKFDLAELKHQLDAKPVKEVKKFLGGIFS